MKRLIPTILFLSLIVSCEDQLTKTDVVYRDTLSVCPGVNPEAEPSKFNFSGIEAVTNITETNATVTWQHVDGMIQYHIISLTDSSREVLQTINAPTNQFELKTLTPNTDYNLMVRAFDNEGRIDHNVQVISFKTLPWPNYTNTVSMNFNSSQSINLGSSSKYFPNTRFTISSWYKLKNLKDMTDQRLFTFHRSNSAGSAVSLNLTMDQIVLKFSDSDNKLKQAEAIVDHNDNSWHHIAVGYNGSGFKVYLDGLTIMSVPTTFSGFGDFPAYIASYVGYQKGFSGLIDEFAIFNDFLSPASVSEIYNSSEASDLRNHSRAEKLSTWYRMGDHNLDNKDHIEDIIGTNHALPFNIENTDFVSSSP